MGSGLFSSRNRQENRPDPIFRVRAAALAALIACCAPHAALAQVPGDSPPAVTARFNVDWLSAVRVSTANDDSPLNPGNVRLRLPQLLAQTELRGNVRAEFGSRVLLVLRPRVAGTAEWSWATREPRTDAREAEAEFTEAYLAWTVADPVTITYGLQNFQWGPAELVAPNNRIFHETGVFRDPLYYVPGRHLLRVNVSAGRQWSLVALGELGASPDETFRAGERFARQGLAKVEYTTADGASYAGLTLGATAGAPWWIGGYGSLALTEGLSVYADTSHTRGSRAWYPSDARSPAPPTFARPRVDERAWNTFAVVGARYTFARGDDLRVEWMSQQAGWSEDDLELAFDAARFASSADAFAPYLRAGLEFLGRQFLLLSVRTPELPPRKRVEVQSRYLHAFTDGSRVLFVTSRVEATDRLVLFATGTLTGGPDHGEFSRILRGSLVVGSSVTW